MLFLLILATVSGLATGQLLTHGFHQTGSIEQDYCPVFYEDPPKDCKPLPQTFVEFRKDDFEPSRAGPEVLEDAFAALEILQDEFFDADYGTWPSAIDWTGAVVETIVSGMLTTLTRAFDNDTAAGDAPGWKAKENLLSSYFAEVINSYYGQDILSLRGEAFDDMLWVVLGWIEGVTFVREHAKRHYSGKVEGTVTGSSRLHKALENKPWHGSKWIPDFAHRARIFWNAASRGWDTSLCGGGMVWDRRLSPYKNAITNELWISASISMYQYWPGDNITSPWTIDDECRKKDPEHLAAAIEGYKWLYDVNMINKLGLFVDGYHISRQRGSTRCDLRNEMVYTYNQGVLLSGQRGLWSVTGSASYLEDGHDLIQSVIKATGWNLHAGMPVDALESGKMGGLPLWRGLGRGGIMEERCDASGGCSQDGQAFKGIFFHHLTTFCAALDPITVAPGVTLDVEGFHRVKTAHSEACEHYLGWVRHNALAAMGTRDTAGVFGMWWGAGLFEEAPAPLDEDTNERNATDYRNLGMPHDDIWGTQHRFRPGTKAGDEKEASGRVAMGMEQTVMRPHSGSRQERRQAPEQKDSLTRDPNARGRGRTVETQMSGLSLLRAYWELSQVDETVA
ncbi:glycosyl hydrolase family 76 domain-containing protein [Sarocladium implicatum]|nr:glycosyl hydrolase family 76 domain-containing protein [Sarocladium implicatum]